MGEKERGRVVPSITHMKMGLTHPVNIDKSHSIVGRVEVANVHTVDILHKIILKAESGAMTLGAEMRRSRAAKRWRPKGRRQGQRKATGKCGSVGR